VYQGASSTAGEEATPAAVTYNIVMALAEPILNQGYKVYMDNWYTSSPLFKALLEKGTLACGTIHPFRSCFKNIDKETEIKWAKTVNRGNLFDVRWGPCPQQWFSLGSFRYHRHGQIIEFQWMDRSSVSLISNFHAGSDYDHCVRHVKVKK
jgi:hypothetical protein